MDQVKFALRIKEARKEKGWTQKELAERLLVSDKAVSKWECMKSMPDIELLGPISKELEIPLIELLGMEDMMLNIQETDMEKLLQRLLPMVKEKIQEEIHKKKRLLLTFLFLCLLLIPGCKAYKYAKYAIPVPIEAVSAEYYLMKDGGISVNISVSENYPVTHGWSWDNEEFLISISAMRDRLPLKWLYWIEEHLPIIGATGRLEGNSIEFILSEEEAMATKIIFYGENDESVILYEPGIL